jgi:hypothetical protein
MKCIGMVAVLCSIALTTGCTSLPLSALPELRADQSAEILVFRNSSFNAGLVSLTVGTGDKAFARLENDEYVRVQLPAGDVDLFVQARSAEPTRVKVSTKPGQFGLLPVS